jgi:hypothetical protein
LFVGLQLKSENRATDFDIGVLVMLVNQVHLVFYHWNRYRDSAIDLSPDKLDGKEYWESK